MRRARVEGSVRIWVCGYTCPGSCHGRLGALPLSFQFSLSLGPMGQGMCPYYLWSVIANQSSLMYPAERDEKHTVGLVYVGSLSIATRPLRRAALSGFFYIGLVIRSGAPPSGEGQARV